MASIVMPMIGPLAGAGMIKAILSILVQFSLIDNTTQTYQIFYMVADCVFYYMPFFLAFSAGKKFKCNPYLSLIFAAMLVHPTYLGLKTAGDPVTLLGLPVTLATYTSSVVPIILIVYFQSIVEKWVTKWTPKAIKTFFVPMIVILVTVPVGFIVLGPLARSSAIIWHRSSPSWTRRSAGWFRCWWAAWRPLLVMTGMHYALGSAIDPAGDGRLCDNSGAGNGLQQHGAVGGNLRRGAENEGQGIEITGVHRRRHSAVRHYGTDLVRHWHEIETAVIQCDGSWCDRRSVCWSDRG